MNTHTCTQKWFLLGPYKSNVLFETIGYCEMSSVPLPLLAGPFPLYHGMKLLRCPQHLLELTASKTEPYKHFFLFINKLFSLWCSILAI